MKKKLDTRFPAARIKKIMQADEEVGKIAQATPVLISKALELFLQDLCDKAYAVTLSKGAKTLSGQHLKQCVLAKKEFDFLQEVVAKVPDSKMSEDGNEEGQKRSTSRRNTDRPKAEKSERPSKASKVPKEEKIIKDEEVKQEKEELKLEEEKPVVEEVPAKRKRKQLLDLDLNKGPEEMEEEVAESEMHAPESAEEEVEAKRVKVEEAIPESVEDMVQPSALSDEEDYDADD